MKRTLFGLAAVAVFAVAVPAVTADDKKSEPFTDEMFVKTAASSGMHEVEVAKLVAPKVKSAEVKKFAEQLVTDHTKVNEKLKAVATSAGIALPERLMEKHQKHVDHFKDAKAEGLDKEYIDHMVKGHEDGVALFRRASTEAKNAALKQLAQETLPTLEEHLKMAKQLQTSLTK